MAKRSASSNFSIMAASKGEEESQEYRTGKHGLFTYALLRGLSRRGDANRDGKVSLLEAFNYTKSFVQANREIKEKPQTPQLQSPEILKKMTLSGT
ncbi:MAG: hypothetical protein HQL50_03290 [Magnetococcales bacterium]|nr:hypothetical protein [Magnetococcales bacterium]